ncbi:MAG: response regulator [Acetobacteraceae bacterium]|nr:response regulator [Acetobacteraceae bacterium]
MRILVADDDPDFRHLAVRQVRREFPDDEIVEVGDRAGLDRVLGERPPPGLLVSDYSLNWADGFEILAAVRTLVPDCPAVMFTGTGNEDVAVRAIKSGFDDYVVKSVKQLRRLATACRTAVTRTEARRRLQQHGDLLTHELYHRLHNNLQLVISLISLTARAVADEDAKRKLRDLGQRVGSLSLLQERLYRGGNFAEVDFAAYLRELAGDLAGLNGRGIAVAVTAEDGLLPVDVAVPLGLVANELVTNALKHAFPGKRAGRIAVRLKRRDDRGIVLEVLDDGVGVPESGVGEPGAGMGLVRRLVAQVGGALEMRRREGGGTACRVTVPGPGPTR